MASNKLQPPALGDGAAIHVGAKSKLAGASAASKSPDPSRFGHNRVRSGDSQSDNDHDDDSGDDPGDYGDDDDSGDDRKLSAETKKAPDQADKSKGKSGMTEEERKLEAKRAYNRANAARARKRVKEQLAELCEKVEKVSDKNKRLKTKNDELENLVLKLSEENQMLRRVLTERNIAFRSNVLGTRLQENDMTQRLFVDGGVASASTNLTPFQSISASLSATSMLPQLSSLVALPSGLQQQYASQRTHRSGDSPVAHPSPSQQRYQFLNPGDPSRPWMPPTYPPPHSDGKM